MLALAPLIIYLPSPELSFKLSESGTPEELSSSTLEFSKVNVAQASFIFSSAEESHRLVSSSLSDSLLIPAPS